MALSEYDAARERVRRLRSRNPHNPARIASHDGQDDDGGESAGESAESASDLLEAVQDFDRELIENVRTAALRPGQENALVSLLREARDAREAWMACV